MLTGTGILSRLLPKRYFWNPGCVSSAPELFSVPEAAAAAQGLIVSAGYSLNKVRPKLTPGKPTLRGNIATIRPGLLKRRPASRIVTITSRG